MTAADWGSRGAPETSRYQTAAAGKYAPAAGSPGLVEEGGPVDEPSLVEPPHARKAASGAARRRARVTGEPPGLRSEGAFGGGAFRHILMAPLKPGSPPQEWTGRTAAQAAGSSHVPQRVLPAYSGRSIPSGPTTSHLPPAACRELQAGMRRPLLASLRVGLSLRGRARPSRPRSSTTGVGRAGRAGRAPAARATRPWARSSTWAAHLGSVRPRRPGATIRPRLHLVVDQWGRVPRPKSGLDVEVAVGETATSCWPKQSPWATRSRGKRAAPGSRHRHRGLDPGVSQNGAEQ